MRLLLVALVAVLAAVILAVQNASAVAVELFFWQVQAPLAVLIAVSFAAGALVSWLISLLRLRRLRAQERRLMAQLADLEAVSKPATARTDSPPDPMNAKVEKYAPG